MTLFLQNGGLMPRTMESVVRETLHIHRHHNNVNHFLALLALFCNNTQNPHWNVDHAVVYICSCNIMKLVFLPSGKGYCCTFAADSIY